MTRARPDRDIGPAPGGAAVASDDDWVALLDARLAELDHLRSRVVPDARAQAIAAAVVVAGRGGRQRVADHLGITVGAVDQAIKRDRTAVVDPVRGMSMETLLRLLAVEAAEVEPLRASQWAALAWLVRQTGIDGSWLEQLGELLAEEVRDAELPAEVDPDGLRRACAAWTRVQAVAVVDCCQRDLLHLLPTRPDPDR
jgi:hypothetical protein